MEGLQAWKANIDVQPVFSCYKAVTYMCTYFSKAEDETSEAMKQAAKETLHDNKSDYEKNGNKCKSICNKNTIICPRSCLSCHARTVVV